MKLTSKIVATFFLCLGLGACVSTKGSRYPAAVDLSGTYLGEGLYLARRGTDKLTKPAVRLYLNKDLDSNDGSYLGVLLEYDSVNEMAIPFLTAQNAPKFKEIAGHLTKIATKISAYRVVPRQDNNFDLRPIKVQGSELVSEASSLILKLGKASGDEHALVGARIVGDPEGDIHFPTKTKQQRGLFEKVITLGGAIPLSQYELAEFTYRKGKLNSTWRLDYENLEGSYLSAYARNYDGVMELFSEGDAKKAEFFASTTKASDYTNSKSAGLKGVVDIIEPVDGILVIKTPKTTAAHRVLEGRLGLFLDIFDASSEEAGGHKVVEIAFLNPDDPTDFLMYYQHPEHLKNVGVR